MVTLEEPISDLAIGADNILCIAENNTIHYLGAITPSSFNTEKKSSSPTKLNHDEAVIKTVDSAKKSAKQAPIMESYRKN